MVSLLKKRIVIVIIFAIAMAFLEAATVVYLRKIFEPRFLTLTAQTIKAGEIAFSLGALSFLKQSAAIKLIPDAKIILIEQLREAAVILMIFCVSLLTAKLWRKKLAFFLLIFGLWDIYYYIFLYLLIGWPKSLLEKDILFLIPFPWVAPVILPIGASLLMIMGSYFLLKRR